ncbi:transporter [Sphingomonas sp. NBWT7]|nr:transporter [Sphingomonas sp. NBWT7]
MLLAWCAAAPARAQERDYCAARPGLGTPACTMAPGRVSVEIAIADWQRDDSGDVRDDLVTLAETQLRIGLTETSEAVIGWAPFGRQRTRNAASGGVTRESGVGDVYLGLQANLANPDGSGFSIAVQPFVTVPIGGAPLGVGDWGAGILVPVSYDVSDALKLEFTGEANVVPDADGHGRHAAYSGTVGLDVVLGEAVETTIEVQGLRDRDPTQRATQWLGALSFDWKPTDDLQLDVGANVALDADAPDAEIYVGIARRF